MYRVGLTGGIASGKTTVANLFAALGIPVIDTDVIARQVVEPGESALAAVVHAFGQQVLGADGRLDRPRMREQIFGDAQARQQLEAILHPAIRAEMERQSRAAGGPYQVLVIPLLVEGGRREHLDRVLVVDVPETTQIERLVRRDGVPREQAEAALRSQASREARLAFADDVIENTADLVALQSSVARLHEEYLHFAAHTRP